MARPYEVPRGELSTHIEELVDAVFGDIHSQFLVMPRGNNFVEYREFQSAFEALRINTNAFRALTRARIWKAFCANSLSLVVLRTILGVSPPEWAELARINLNSDISQGYARHLENRCRSDPEYLRTLVRPRHSVALDRLDSLIDVAVKSIGQGSSIRSQGTVHRLDKVDTYLGLRSLQHVTSHHVPYAMLLYERYLGRPFASHRDSVSELVGDVMETAIEERLTVASIPFRKTKRAERLPGFDQAPDFLVPDEFNPAVAIEAKITGDDGTARDKVARIERLTRYRDDRRSQGISDVEIIACVDGRGFGIRRGDMRNLILMTEGKVFTLANLDQLISHTRLREFKPRSNF